MNRDFILKNFWNKLNEAKKLNVREIKMTLKEMDDLGFIIFELMSEYYNKTIDNIKNKPTSNEENSFTMDGGEF